MKEKLYRRQRVYKGRAVSFSADEIILPNGKKAFREYMEHPGAVAVIPFVDKDNIILVKQYRYPVNKVTYEIPAGKLDKKENRVSCVKRELEEETGFKAGKIKKLLSYWPTAAFANEVIHIYTATDLKKGQYSPDHDEFIEFEIVGFKQVLGWIDKGLIQDSKTIIALLYWARRKNI